MVEELLAGWRELQLNRPTCDRSPPALVCVAACAAPLQRATTVPPASGAAPAISKSSQPPRVGVAFGGGSARGIAHVGVIRWLEEHRIPDRCGGRNEHGRARGWGVCDGHGLA